MKTAALAGFLTLGALGSAAEASPISVDGAWGACATEGSSGELARKDGRRPPIGLGFGEPSHVELGVTWHATSGFSVHLGVAVASHSEFGAEGIVPTDTTGLNYRGVSWPAGRTRFECALVSARYGASMGDKSWSLGYWIGPTIGIGRLAGERLPAASEDSLGVSGLETEAGFLLGLETEGDLRLARTPVSLFVRSRLLGGGPRMTVRTTDSSEFESGEGRFSPALFSLGLSVRVP